MEYLGFGINLDLDENVTKRVDPIIQEMERLRKKMRDIDKAGRNVNEGLGGRDSFYESKRRRQLRQYYTSMQSLDRVLLNVSQQFVRATYSANALSKATNRMQFTGNFTQIHSGIMQTQTMLGNMGYAMSRQQKSASDMQAYNTLNYTMKDLNDRIKLTKQALSEMEKSGDASKYPEQYNLAKESLRAFNEELKRSGDLQQKLADTHGYGIAKGGLGKDVLYDPAKSKGQYLANRLIGASMGDMAVASDIAYKSLDKTGKMITGSGYTYNEARMKLNALLMQMQMAGTMMSQFVTMPILGATAGIGMMMDNYEEASNVMHARALIPKQDQLAMNYAMADISVDTGATRQQTGEALSMAYGMYNGDVDRSQQEAQKAMFMSKVHGISHEKSLKDVQQLTEKFGVSSEQAWDMYVAGAMEAKEASGKGFTGKSGIDRIMEHIEESPEKFKEMTKEGNKYADAYERMEDNYDKGIMEGIMEGAGQFVNSIQAVFESLRSPLEKATGFFSDKMEGMTEYFRENKGVAKWTGIIAGATATVGAMAGPIGVVTALMVRHRNVIEGVTATFKGFSKGGFAVLSPQAKMAKDLMNSMTVAFARFPQTVMTGAIPALYSFIRGVPALALKIMKLNPLMTGLGLGAVAYSKNWLGFRDTVDNVVGKVTTTVDRGKGIVTSFMEGKDVDLSKYNKWEQRIGAIAGAFEVIPKIAKGAWKGEEINFTDGETAMIEGLDIAGPLASIAGAISTARDVWSGFKDGVVEGAEMIKSAFTGIMSALAPVVDYIGDRAVDIFNFFSKMFGGGEVEKVGDIIDKIGLGMEEGATKAEKFGKAIGLALTAITGFKLGKGLAKMVVSPFVSAYKSIKTAQKRLDNFARKLQGLPTKKVVRVQAQTVMGPEVYGGGDLNLGGGKGKGGKGGKAGEKQGKEAKKGFFRGFFSGGGKESKGSKGFFSNLLGKSKTLSAGKKVGGLLMKGVGGALRLGLRAIPIVGWAFTAFEAIGAVFRNWDSIKKAGGKAWDWIKENGGKAMSTMWEGVKSGASGAWEKTKEVAGNVWDSVKEKVGPVWDSFKEKAGNAWDSVKEFGSDVVDGFGEAWTNLWDGLGEIGTWAWDTISEKAGTMWEDVKEKAGNMWEGFTEKSSEVWDSVKEFGTDVWEGIKEAGTNFWEGLGEAGTNFWEGVKELGTNTWEGIKEAGTSIWDSVSETASTVWDTVSEAGKTMWDNVKEAGSNFWDGLSEAGSNFWEGITELGTTAWETLKTSASDLFDGLDEMFSGAWDTAKDFASESWDKAKGYGETAWNATKGFGESAWEGISGVAKGVYEGIRDFELFETVSADSGVAFSEVEANAQNMWQEVEAGSDGVWDGVAEGAGEAFSEVESESKSMWESVKEGATNLWEGVSEKSGEIWDGVSESAGEMWDSVKEGASNLWEEASEGATTMWDNAKEGASTLWEGVTEGASTMWQTVGEGATIVWETAREGASVLWDGISEGASSLWETVSSGATSAFSAIGSTITETFSNVWTGITETASAVWTGVSETVTTFVTTATEMISTGFSTVWEGVTTFATTAWTTIQTLGTTAVTGITSFMSSAFSGAFNTVTSIASSAWSTVSSTATAMLSGLVGTFGSMGTSMGTSLRAGIIAGMGDLNSLVSSRMPKGAGGGGPAYADGGFIRSAHYGLVGEAGPEVIIPLSKNKRTRANSLLAQAQQQYGLGGEGTPERVDASSLVKTSSTKSTRSGNEGGLHIGNVSINVQGNEANGGKVDGKKIASEFMSELSKLYEMAKMRGRGENLSFEEFVTQFG